MYSVTVEVSFCAIHRIRLPDGMLEPRHGHDWRVSAHFAAHELDEKGLVVDFEVARAGLRSVVSDLHHKDLNELEAFAGRSPTAEVVAKYVFDRTKAIGLTGVTRVEVTEAPGCSAAYEL